MVGMRIGRRVTIGLAVVAALPLLYVLSFGPACWITAQVDVGGWDGAVPPRAMIVYWPLGSIGSDTDSHWGRSLRWWMTLEVKKGYSAVAPASPKGNALIVLSPHQ